MCTFVVLQPTAEFKKKSREIIGHDYAMLWPHLSFVDSLFFQFAVGVVTPCALPPNYYRRRSRQHSSPMVSVAPYYFPPCTLSCTDISSKHSLRTCTQVRRNVHESGVVYAGRNKDMRDPCDHDWQSTLCSGAFIVWGPPIYSPFEFISARSLSSS